jgi:hypothetical protein
LGAKGLICGGLPDNDFKNEIKKEVFLVDGEEVDISLPILVIGSGGEVSPEDWQVLKKSNGKKVLLESEKSLLLIPKEDEED